MANQAEVKPSRGACVGALAGCALLLFAGALVATSQIPGMGQANLRRLQLTASPAPSLTVTTTIAADTIASLGNGNVGSTTLDVVTADPPFVIGQWVMVGVGLDTVEERHIKQVDLSGIAGVTMLEFHSAKGLEFPHVAGEIVALIPENSADQFENQISSGSSDSLKSMKDSSGSSFSSLDSSASLESGSSEGNLPKTLSYAEGSVGGGTWLLNVLLGLCYACVYKSKVVDQVGVIRHQPLQHEMHNDFRFGLCDCFKDINICLMAWFCPFVRMAHTNEAADVCGFWESLACLFCSSLCVCGPMCLQVYFRIHIKDHMGIQDHCFNDFCLAFFCLPCITGQQAMAVDEVLGYKFKCPCTFEKIGGFSGGYGQAAGGNWS